MEEIKKLNLLVLKNISGSSVRAVMPLILFTVVRLKASLGHFLIQDKKCSIASHIYLKIYVYSWLQIHKYIIQGYVVRNSWPLTKQQWDFVDNIKTAEEDESKSLLTLIIISWSISSYHIFVKTNSMF